MNEHYIFIRINSNAHFLLFLEAAHLSTLPVSCFRRRIFLFLFDLGLSGPIAVVLRHRRHHGQDHEAGQGGPAPVGQVRRPQGRHRQADGRGHRRQAVRTRSRRRHRPLPEEGRQAHEQEEDQDEVQDQALPQGEREKTSLYRLSELNSLQRSKSFTFSKCLWCLLTSLPCLCLLS